MQSLQNGLQLPTPHQPGTGNANSLPSDTVHTHYYGYKEFVPPMQRPGLSSSSDPSCSFPGPPHTPLQTGNNAQHIDGAAALHNKNYHLQPPPPMLSNQFSYVQADQRAHSWMEASSSSFTKRFQFGHDMHRDNMYDSSQERMQHEIDERCRLPPPPIHPGMTYIAVPHDVYFLMCSLSVHWLICFSLSLQDLYILTILTLHMLLHTMVHLMLFQIANGLILLDR